MMLSGKKKFIAALVGLAYMVFAQAGLNLPVEETAAGEAVIALYLLVEFFLDLARNKKGV